MICGKFPKGGIWLEAAANHRQPIVDCLIHALVMMRQITQRIEVAWLGNHSNCRLAIQHVVNAR